MTPVIEVKGLPQNKRRLIFIFAIILFIIAVPISVFYAIGYRFDFTDHITSIKSVGGMYIRNDTQNTEMFINNEPVVDMRVFQKAAYIQNLEAGMHRVHIQGKDVHTWVKELPVYAHFVTEVSSFNLPRVPQIRIITEWNNPATGAGIMFDTATSTQFSFASTTNTLMYASSTATSTYTHNPEYLYVQSLFASTTNSRLAMKTQKNAVASKPFNFDTATKTIQTVLATTSKSWRNFTLKERGDDVVMVWKGNLNDVPYYYCIHYEDEPKTVSQYGQHVYNALAASVASSTLLKEKEGERICRSSIRIDDLNKKVLWFDFFPDSTDLVLMQLEDGLYVVEVDDRAWQNTQPLYLKKDIEVLQDGGRIFIHDGLQYLEVFTQMGAQ